MEGGRERGGEARSPNVCRFGCRGVGEKYGEWLWDIGCEMAYPRIAFLRALGRPGPALRGESAESVAIWRGSTGAKG